MHNCLLVEHCPHCQEKTSANRSKGLTAGYCAKCQQWLGQSAFTLTSIRKLWNQYELNHHQYIRFALEDIIVNLPYLSFFPGKLKSSYRPLNKVGTKLETFYDTWIIKLNLKILKNKYYFPTYLYYLDSKPTLKTLLTSFYSDCHTSFRDFFYLFKLRKTGGDISILNQRISMF